MPTVANSSSTASLSAGPLVQYEDSVQFVCDTGHEMDDGTESYVVTCNASALWDGPGRACERKDW